MAENRKSYQSGDLAKIFRRLQDTEEATEEVSFTLDDVENKEDREKVMSADIDHLRQLCLDLIQEARQDKKTITTLISESQETKKKVTQLEEKLEKHEEILCTVINRLEENKKLESTVKRSEERVDKMENDKKALEKSVKKAEQSMSLSFNEVVKMRKGVQEDKSEMAKISSEVKEAITNVKTVVKDGMKENANIIREESDRAKSIIITGIPEPKMDSEIKRQDHLKKVIHEVFDEIKDDEDRWMEDVLQIRRVGRYDPNKGELNKRPVKVRFDSERTAMEVMALARKLRRVEKMNGVYINQDLSVTERSRLYELRMKAKNENEARSEEEAKKYFFAVRRGRVMKLTKRDVIEEELGATGGEEAPHVQP